MLAVLSGDFGTLLTVSVPAGLQFGAGVGRIRNQSVTDGVGLQVQPGKTLALVGG